MSYVINYSGQPFEPVYDMLSRVDSDFVLYEEIETVRTIYEQDKERIFKNMAYGFLKASSNNEGFLRKMQKKLNKENTGGVIFNVADKEFDYRADLLPARSVEPIAVPRLLKYRKSAFPVKILHEREIQGLNEFPDYITSGFYLCFYNDNYVPVRIRLIAQSEDSAAIIQFRNSIALDLGWRSAILDVRAEREFFVAPGYAEPENTLIYSNSDDVLSQTEIDILIEKMVREVSL